MRSKLIYLECLGNMWRFIFSVSEFLKMLTLRIMLLRIRNFVKDFNK